MTTQPTNELEQKLGEVIDDLVLYEPCNVSGCDGKCHKAKHNQSLQRLIDIISAHDKEIDRQARIDELNKLDVIGLNTGAIIDRDVIRDRLSSLKDSK